MTATNLQSGVAAEERRGLLLSIFSTVDHKVIGLMYIATALFFLLVGGCEALVMRLQLASANNDLVSPEAFNQLFTMHGTTMIFLVGMPIFAGFANYLVPLMIGARDVAFPRLNALGYWMLPLGGFLLHYSLLTGAAPDAGWFAYAPLSTEPFSSRSGIDYWILGLLVMGIGSVVSALNILVTMIKYRAPGMRLGRLPLFAWMAGFMSILVIMVMPVLNAALVMLLADRILDSAFFQPSRGGSALLWQHYFWIFGHPEVYVFALPAFGMISEVIPVFSRKPIYGYGVIAGSTVVIAFLGYGVWAHHMFAVGMSSGANIFFAVGSLLIAIPTGIKIFNWTATMWGGSIHFTTSMLFAIAFLFQFTIGGLSGITFAVAPLSWQTTDTYYVVAHFHYVLVGGILFAIFAASYYWFPKASGRMLSERLGRWHFWLLVLGFNMTFGVQHLLGFMGMPRRVYTYADEPGWALLNLISTVGAFIMAFAIGLFLVNVVMSWRRGQVAGDNPWGAFTLEWLTTSPPPEYNFERVPLVRDRRPVWSLDHPDKADYKLEKTPEDRRFKVDKARVSAGFFLQSESVFFVILLSSFIIFNSRADEGPTADSALNVGRTALFSILLLSSSLTVWLAEKRLQKNDRAGFLRWLLFTIVLGLAFLGGQAWEYTGLIEDGVTISRNHFSSTFFAVTGFHGLHVFGGIVALGILFWMGCKGAMTAGRSAVFGAVSLYWHFVDIVWIAVFCIIYLGVFS